MVAAAVAAVAAFLPWASFLGYTKYGIDGDGRITLALALIGLVLAFQGWLGWLGQLVLATIVGISGLIDVSDAGSLAAIGLYLTFLAGGGWVVGAFMLRAASAVPSAPAAADAAEPPAPQDATSVEP
jgi:hypothetical protein